MIFQAGLMEIEGKWPQKSKEAAPTPQGLSKFIWCLIEAFTLLKCIKK